MYTNPDSTPFSLFHLETHEEFADLVAWKVTGAWNWSDFSKVFKNSESLNGHAPRGKDLTVLIDMQESPATPSGGIIYIHQAFMKCKYDNVFVVICSPDLFMRLLISSYHRVLQSFHLQIKVAQNLEQGLEILQRMQKDKELHVPASST